ncbi:MAG: phosphoribosyltransferase [Candidatus Liptonbacteria bacterium]|nr:phosphoribosyltransferase [Candidatus Liptonbacteria bacterium]
MTSKRVTFEDRIDAGKQLAEALLPYQAERPLILALPRGGAPAGYETATKLKAPLDTVVARKIGAPSDPEFGVGALAPGDVIVLNNEAIETLAILRKELDPIIAAEMEEMERRMVHYKSGAYSEDIEAGTVILVDDGLATGVTARAAIESVRLMRKPKKIVFAAPICAIVHLVDNKFVGSYLWAAFCFCKCFVITK